MEMDVYIYMGLLMPISDYGVLNMKKIIFLFLFMLLILGNLAYADEIILKVFKDEHNYYYGLFIPPNVIVIYGHSSFNAKLQHELQHYYCYKLFGDMDEEHKRCFSENYNKGIGFE